MYISPGLPGLFLSQIEGYFIRIGCIVSFDYLSYFTLCDMHDVLSTEMIFLPTFTGNTITVHFKISLTCG